MFATIRPRRSIWLVRALLLGLALIAGCAGRAPQASSPTPGAAVVHNSIHVGLIETTFFVVDSVDGTTVHEKMDFKRHVEIAAGRHQLSVTYYTDALWGARDSAETCEIAFEAEPGGSYRVEGDAEGSEWLARLVDDRTGRELPCRFSDERGASEVELANRPAATPIPEIETGASSSREPVAIAAAGVKPSTAADDENTALPPRSTTSRHRSLCGRGFYRVARAEGPATFVLERSDRVRLIGVQADRPDARLADAMSIEGECVRFDYEATNLIDGHRDRDGRLLAYVYLKDGTFVNLELIRTGRVRASDQRHRHLADFLAAQSEARKAGLGVWAR